jgi:hypothetical protein
MEIVERGDACDDRSECLRDLRIGDVREVSRAMYRERVDRRVKRALHLIERAGKLDEIAGGSEVFDPEAVSLEPGADCLDVRIRGTELGSKLRGGEPAMKVWRCGVLQIGQIRGERLLLGGASLQDEGETAGGGRGRGRSSIEAGLREGMNIATERNKTAFIDGRDDPRLGSGLAGEGKGGCEKGGQKSRFHVHGPKLRSMRAGRAKLSRSA